MTVVDFRILNSSEKKRVRLAPVPGFPGFAINVTNLDPNLRKPVLSHTCHTPTLPFNSHTSFNFSYPSSQSFPTARHYTKLIELEAFHSEKALLDKFWSLRAAVSKPNNLFT